MDLTGVLEHLSSTRAGVGRTGWNILAQIIRSFSQQMPVNVAFVVRYQDQVDCRDGLISHYSYYCENLPCKFPAFLTFPWLFEGME